MNKLIDGRSQINSFEGKEQGKNQENKERRVRA
jgi:hypothetical protein